MNNSQPTRVFITYTHDSGEHKKQVLAFAAFLRRHGLDVQIDAWDSYMRKDWYEWGQRQITLADFTLVVVSHQYKKVGDGEVGAQDNRGAQAEVAALRELIQHDRPTWIRRILPVLLPGHTPDEIPLFLQPLTADHYKVDDLTPSGADSLIRVLTAQPENVAPPIGTVPLMRPASVPDSWGDNRRTSDSVQINTAQGGSTVFAVQDGDLHVSDYRNAGEEPLDEPPWSRLTKPVDVEWFEGKGASAVLELHLVPVDEVDRLQMRRLNAMPDELAALGRREKLFTVAEGLDCGSSTTTAWATAVRRDNHDVAGLAITSDGHRSVWSSLPRDDMGAILDRHDLVHRLSMLLQILVRAEAPLPKRFAPAIGISSASFLVEGTAGQAPRSSATFHHGLLTDKDIRVPVDESVPARLLLDDPAEVVEELAARLLAQFRETTR